MKSMKESSFWIQVGFLVCFINYLFQIFNGFPVMAFLLLFLRWVLDSTLRKPLKALYINLSSIFLLVLILTIYKGQITQDASLSFLMMLTGLKNLEAKNLRDEKFLKLLLLLNTGSCFLFSFEFLTVSLGLIASLCFFKSMNAQFKFKQIGLSWVLFSLFLFIFFPRLSNPFQIHGFNSSTFASGFSDDLSPGSIENIAQNKSAAFFVKFNPPFKNSPASNYWVGQILTETQGLTWKRKSKILKKEIQGKILKKPDYEVTLEPHNSHWIFSMEGTETLEGENLNLLLREGPFFESAAPIQSSQIYKGWLGNQKVNFSEQDLQLPKNMTALLPTFGKNLTALDVGKKLDAWILKNNFKYTLNPGKKSKDLESFLNSKVGFCEHFAALGAIIFRFHQFPARVVIGYQGGKYLPTAEVWKFIQADAHAWSEYWNGDQWIRYDLTRIVAPERLTLGGDLFSKLPDDLIGTKLALVYIQSRAQPWLESLKSGFDTISYSITYFFLTYDLSAQTDLIRFLFSSAGFIILALILLILTKHLIKEQSLKSKNPLKYLIFKKLKRDITGTQSLEEIKDLFSLNFQTKFTKNQIEFIFLQFEKSIYDSQWKKSNIDYKQAYKILKTSF